MDKAVLKDCKRRSTKLAMAWIDYRKAYDVIPHSWISECFEVPRGIEKTKNVLVATSNGVSLGHAEIRRGIFQVDSLSAFLFVIFMVPLSLILGKIKFYYEFADKKTWINHLLIMDHLKLFKKSNDQIDSLVNTVHTFSEDIGMEFGIRKCGFST